MRILLLIVALALAACGAQPGSGNSVAAYLENAQVQAETDAQRLQVRRALTDIIEKPASDLRAQRYRDHSGAQAWLVSDVLRAHVVPSTPQALDPERFFDDAAKPEAKQAARKVLERMTPP
jgi:hypothetical protein